MIEKLLKKHNLTWEELNDDERTTLTAWINALQSSALSVEKIRGYISQLKMAVEKDLATTGLDQINDIFLKARLRNLMLLDAMMTSPASAQQHLEAALSNIAAKKQVG